MHRGLRALCTTPSPARSMASAGQTSAHVGCSQCMQTTGTVWTEQAKLVASDAFLGDDFGGSVSLSGDTAAVGAGLDDTFGGFDAGSAYVFVRTGAVWTEVARLIADDAATIDYFGFSVSLSGDTAIVGAYGDDNAGGQDAGAAYAHEWNASCTTRNDAGSLNPLILDCLNDPVVGTTWQSRFDAGSIGGSGFTLQIGTGLSSSGIPTNFGVLLIDLSQPVLALSFGIVSGGASTHSVPIPNDTSLIGLPVYMQGYIDDVGGVGKLTNGLDLKVGL
jgi:hypothetical protein